VGGAATLSAVRRLRGWATDERRTARLLIDNEPRLAILVGLWLVAASVTSTLLLLTLGRVLAHVPPVLHDGWSSPAGHSLVRWLVVLGAAYAFSVGLNGVRAALGTIVKVRLTYKMHGRLMHAVSRPTGIGHLEDPAVLDRLALAQGTLMTFFPADAPLFLADVLAARTSGFLACVLVGTFRWWLGLLLVVLNLAMRPRLMKAQMKQVQLFGGNGGIMRRAFYFHWLATRADAAKEIRVFGLADWVVENLERYWREGMAASWANLTELRREVAKLFAVVMLAYLVIALYLGHEAQRGAQSLSHVAVVLGAMAGTVLLGSITFSDVSLAWTMSALPHFDDIDDEVARRETVHGGGAPSLGKPEREIAFEHVSFAYPGSTHEVFRGLDVRLVAGRSTAIVGPNGAGKTTLVKLLAGLHDPTDGRITIDGTDLAALDASAWQRQVAVVFQDFNRYPLTAAVNVGLGAPAHLDDHEGLRAAADAAGALATIEELPDGWDTVLAPDLGGVELSGGQWQRLALARALFAARHGARVLVLDEPTAWLDVRGEAAFYETFLDITRGLTTLVISHRFSTVRLADHIYVVDEGRVIEQGSHDELVALGGTYASMFLLQSTHFTDGDEEVMA